MAEEINQPLKFEAARTAVNGLKIRQLKTDEEVKMISRKGSTNTSMRLEKKKRFPLMSLKTMTYMRISRRSIKTYGF